MAEKFPGFANAVNAKGKTVDAREVDAYADESEAGKIRLASQTTPSSILDFKTDGPGTNGSPAAIVPGPKDDASDGDAAEGEGANAS